MTVFRSRVLNVVKRIPPGRVATYGDVAAAAGNGRACRAVGNIMRDCKVPGVPCHRVIAAGGKLGGYGGNLEMKRALLRAEGVRVVGSTVKDFAERSLFPRGAKTGQRAQAKEPATPKRENYKAARRRATRGRRGRV